VPVNRYAASNAKVADSLEGFSEFCPEDRIKRLRCWEVFLTYPRNYWNGPSIWTRPFLYRSRPIYYSVFIVHRLRFLEVFLTYSQKILYADGFEKGQ
jgi:hypothetical protein